MPRRGRAGAAEMGGLAAAIWCSVGYADLDFDVRAQQQWLVAQVDRDTHGDQLDDFGEVARRVRGRQHREGAGGGRRNRVHLAWDVDAQRVDVNGHGLADFDPANIGLFDVGIDPQLGRIDDTHDRLAGSNVRANRDRFGDDDAVEWCLDVNARVADTQKTQFWLATLAHTRLRRQRHLSDDVALMDSRADARSDGFHTSGVHRADLHWLAGQLGVVCGNVQLALAVGVETEYRGHDEHDGRNRQQHAAREQRGPPPRRGRRGRFGDDAG